MAINTAPYDEKNPKYQASDANTIGNLAGSFFSSYISGKKVGEEKMEERNKGVDAVNMTNRALGATGMFPTDGVQHEREVKKNDPIENFGRALLGNKLRTEELALKAKTSQLKGQDLNNAVKSRQLEQGEIMQRKQAEASLKLGDYVIGVTDWSSPQTFNDIMNFGAQYPELQKMPAWVNSLKKAESAAAAKALLDRGIEVQKEKNKGLAAKGPTLTAAQKNAAHLQSLRDDAPKPGVLNPEAFAERSKESQQRIDDFKGSKSTAAKASTEVTEAKAEQKKLRDAIQKASADVIGLPFKKDGDKLEDKYSPGFLARKKKAEAKVDFYKGELSALEEKHSFLKGGAAVPEVSNTAKRMTEPYKPQSKADLPKNVPEASKRVVNKLYPTPLGLMKWTKQGWVKPDSKARAEDARQRDTVGR